MKRIAVIGLGNPLKGDDNIGNVIVEELKMSPLANKDFIFIKAETAPENFILALRKAKPDKICFIDAVDFDGEPGDVILLDIDDVEGVASTHSIPLRFFRSICNVVKLIGIKPKAIEIKQGLSPELRRRIPFIIKKVYSLLNEAKS